MEILLKGGNITTEIDEQIVFNQLDENKNAIFSLFLASGYLKVEYVNFEKNMYTLSLTNYEIKRMMNSIIKGWFKKSEHYNHFLKALLSCDLEAMNEYLNHILLCISSSFDTGKNSFGKKEPERFYHGLVLGLIVELEGTYLIHSNRESGFGRYDIILEPLKKGAFAYIFEFKVHNPKKEKTLEDTAKSGLKQILEKQYQQELLLKGILKEQIHSYAFAFEGKQVLIIEDDCYKNIDY